MNKDITIDDFLGGKIKVKQPVKGFRAGSDAVLLAAVANSCDKKVLDVGCGVGTASLCFAFNNPKAEITAIDVQSELLDLANENITLNSMSNISTKKVNILKDKPDYQIYNSVITNPPFFKDNHGIKSPNDIKQTANTGEVNLEKWVKFCFLSLKDKGDFTIIFRVDRLSELVHIMHPMFGDIKVIPLYPKAGANALRVIVKGKKNTKGITILDKGMVLHKEDGSANMEEILREGKCYDI